VRRPESVGSWLHGVALRVARKLSADAARRRATGLPPAAPTAPAEAEATWREVQAVLDEELARLPEVYRLPLVLCYLEDRTQAEAARLLGWTPGVFRGRLDRGRLRLRDRLARRGVGLSALLVGGSLTPVNAAGLLTMVRPVLETLTDRPASDAVPETVAHLAEGVIPTMTATKLRTAVLAALTVAVGGLLTHGALTARPAQDRPIPPAAPETRPAAQPKEPTDRDRLQGVWKVVRMEADGGGGSFGGGTGTRGFWLVVEGNQLGMTSVGWVSANLANGTEVRVRETNTGSFLIGTGVNSDAGLTGSVVVNERNFDLLRPRAEFRGAGQEFRVSAGFGARIEAVPGTQLQRWALDIPDLPTFTLDPTTQPRGIDLHSSDGKTHQQGIYKITGDELALCLSKPGAAERPKGFAAGKGPSPVLLVLRRADPAELAALADRQKLQGTWQVTRLEAEGDPDALTKLTPPAQRGRLIFAGDHCTLRDDLTDDRDHTFTLDAAITPRGIDLKPAAEPKTVRGVYRFNGDGLTLCLNFAPDGERPKDFTTQKGTRLVTITLKRVAPEAARAGPAEESSPEKIDALVRQVQAEREKLMGDWVRVRAAGEGKVIQPPAPADGPAPPAARTFDEVRVTSDRLSFLFDDVATADHHAYRIDPTLPVKAIDLIAEGPTPGGKPAPVSRGIYKLEGDTLTICFAPSGYKRPREFQADAGGAIQCVTLKRRSAEKK
jgi:uncharacterized protein (TIGR03067 family)